MSIWKTLKEVFFGGKRLVEQVEEIVEAEAKEVVAKVKKPRATKAKTATKKTTKK